MRKHIFGFALFCFIVGSFGFIYAMIAAPALVTPDVVVPPAGRIEPRAEKPHCRFKRETRQFSSEILSSNYLVAERKIVTKIKVRLEDASANPAEIFVGATFTTADGAGPNGLDTFKYVSRPFSEGREQVFVVETPVFEGGIIDLDENLYVSASVTDRPASGLAARNADVQPSKPVLFVLDAAPRRVKPAGTELYRK